MKVQGLKEEGDGWEKGRERGQKQQRRTKQQYWLFVDLLQNSGKIKSRPSCQRSLKSCIRFTYQVRTLSSLYSKLLSFAASSLRSIWAVLLRYWRHELRPYCSRKRSVDHLQKLSSFNLKNRGWGGDAPPVPSCSFFFPGAMWGSSWIDWIKQAQFGLFASPRTVGPGCGVRRWHRDSLTSRFPLALWPGQQKPSEGVAATLLHLQIVPGKSWSSSAKKSNEIK